MEKTVYADYAATTPLRRCTWEAMEPWLKERFYNPSGMYPGGWAARDALEAARADVASCIGAVPDEVYFTSGGTEADNWALRARDRRLISTVEHDAVDEQYCYPALRVDRDGMLYLPSAAKMLHGFSGVVSVMLANNEMGAIEPVEELRALAGGDTLIHTDAVQAVGHIPVDVDTLKVDMLSMSGHKFGGPKGIGALYIRNGLLLSALLRGGGQERGLRSGTENVAGAVGMAAALKEAVVQMPKEMPRLERLRDRLIDGVLSSVPGAKLTGPRVARLPGHASFVFPGTNGHSLVLALAAQGVWASSGSACHAGNGESSSVLKAMGIPAELARGALRMTLGERSTEADVDHILKVLPGCVAAAEG